MASHMQTHYLPVLLFLGSLFLGSDAGRFGIVAGPAQSAEWRCQLCNLPRLVALSRY